MRNVVIRYELMEEYQAALWLSRLGRLIQPRLI